MGVTQAAPAKIAIDAQKVTMPTEETIRRLETQWTGDGKWCQFRITTDQRTVAMDPGGMGQEAFDAHCELSAAMYKTAEGQAFLASVNAFLTGRQLELRPAIAEKAVVAEIPQK
jgi:hypothetical protein